MQLGKRRTDNLRSPREITLDRDKHYDKYIKVDKYKKANRPEVQPEIREIPADSQVRPCWSCGCVNEKGFCDNYFLHAVLRDGCRMPAKEAK